MSINNKSKTLQYHEKKRPGKLSVELSKPLKSHSDMSMAYSPGVAYPVLEIHKDHRNALKYTNKGHLVGIVTNGTAILGLGDLGALASKPVMEGKAMLFKKFANLDAFDIEIDENNPELFIDTVKRISPTFGAINLEDIKAPECFYIENKLINELNIPVFHDDQHGTAITIIAALKNAFLLQKKSHKNAKIVIYGAGASGIATAKLLTEYFQLSPGQIWMFDSKGLITSCRKDLNEFKTPFAVSEKKLTIEETMVGADVFIGLSGHLIESPELCIKAMQKNPIIFPLSNPDPEISIKLIKELRSDAIVATGRSDYCNMVNNALIFPYIFKAALDCQINNITSKLKFSAIEALANIAHLPNEDNNVLFGKDYIIPSMLEPRMRSITKVLINSIND
ncbi:malate dehydrogenase [Gammaproteobacteria bacterium]|nr:malate dehydrogenase [Gammaproteobacteria bacterium]